MKLLLVRHGETDWNAARRFQGHTDIPLNQRGQRQAEAVARILEAECIDRVHTSDLARACDTATPIALTAGCPIEADCRWREIDFGAWEGLTYGEIQLRDPEDLAAWQTNPNQTAPPGGETLEQVTHRVKLAWRDIWVERSDCARVLVAHGGPLRLCLCLALGLTPASHWQFALAPGSISELNVFESGAILTRLNDTHHLREASDGGESPHGSRQ